MTTSGVTAIESPSATRCPRWIGVAVAGLITFGCADYGAKSRADDRRILRRSLDHPVCRICGGRTGAFEVDAWDNCYHRRHVRGVSICHQCDRKCHPAISGAGSRKLDDGRAVCGECGSDAITSIVEAGEAMNRVADELQRRGISVDLRRVTVMLVDQRRLKTSDTTLGLTRSQWMIRRGRRQFDSAVIRVLTCLSTPMFENVIAHELMHVWIAQNVTRTASECAEEGACQLASDLILSTRTNRRARYLREKLRADNDPIYGGCFRRAADLAKRQGVLTVLSRLRQGRGF